MVAIEKPIYLFLLLLIPLGIGLNRYFRYWQIKKQEEFGNTKALEQIVSNRNHIRNKHKGMLQMGAFVCLVIALINPKWGTETETVKAQGVELVFALDVSKSMLCNDVKPNRLEIAKQIIAQTISKLGTDRIGMIAYAGNAHPVLPMTTDYALAKMYLQTINTDLISSQGTAIQSAIETAVDFFDNPNSGKAIILLSDGEDHESGSKIASYAKEKGVKIITIGIGTPQGGNITSFDEYGEPQLKVDREGKVVITKLNTEVLETIASESNGKYILGNQTTFVVEQIKEALEEIKKSEFKDQQLAQQKSQFQWFLLAALLLLLVDLFYLKRKAFSLRFFLPKRALKGIVVLIYISSSHGLAQQKIPSKTPALEEMNREEKLRLIKSKAKEAKEKATYNLGNTIYKAKKYNEAKDKYLACIESAKTKTDKHKAYHNLGNVYMQEKNYEKAMETYKNALKNNPSDEQTRYNLALAKDMLKKNPPEKKQKDKKNKNKNNSKDNKDQQENQKENKKKGDKEKNKEDKKNQNKEKGNQKENQKQQSPKPKGASKQRIENILNAINKDEKRVQQKVNAQKIKSKTIETDKDW